MYLDKEGGLSYCRGLFSNLLFTERVSAWTSFR